MDAAALRKRVTSSLVSEIENVEYPSVTMMDRVETTLGTREDLASYVEALVKKVEGTRFPSVSMLNRLDSLLGRLEQLERQQAESQRDGGRDD